MFLPSLRQLLGEPAWRRRSAALRASEFRLLLERGFVLDAMGHAPPALLLLLWLTLGYRGLDGRAAASHQGRRLVRDDARAFCELTPSAQLRTGQLGECLRRALEAHMHSYPAPALALSAAYGAEEGLQARSRRTRAEAVVRGELLICQRAIAHHRLDVERAGGGSRKRSRP